MTTLIYYCFIVWFTNTIECFPYGIMEYWNVGILSYKSGYYLILCGNLVEFFIIIADHTNLYFFTVLV